MDSHGNIMLRACVRRFVLSVSVHLLIFAKHAAKMSQDIDWFAWRQENLCE